MHRDFARHVCKGGDDDDEQLVGVYFVETVRDLQPMVHEEGVLVICVDDTWKPASNQDGTRVMGGRQISLAARMEL